MKKALSMKFVTGTLCAAVLAVGLIASPLSLASASAQSAAPAATAKPAKEAKPKKPPTAGQLAARERAKKCGAEWKAAKAAGKTEKGETWPKYWSACNKRLKKAG